MSLLSRSLDNGPQDSTLTFIASVIQPSLVSSLYTKIHENLHKNPSAASPKKWMFTADSKLHGQAELIVEHIHSHLWVAPQEELQDSYAPGPHPL